MTPWTETQFTRNELVLLQVAKNVVAELPDDIRGISRLTCHHLTMGFVRALWTERGFDALMEKTSPEIKHGHFTVGCEHSWIALTRDGYGRILDLYPPHLASGPVLVLVTGIGPWVKIYDPHPEPNRGISLPPMKEVTLVADAMRPLLKKWT